MKKFILTGIIALTLGFLTLGLQAQKTAQPEETFFNRLSFGGFLGLQFGSYTYINISPLVSYRATNWFYPGVGFTYMYYQDNRYVPTFSSSYYGPRLFASIYIWRNLYGRIEWEALNIEYFDEPGQRGYIHNILIGGGYRQWLGARSFMTFSILFNVNESIYTPYSNPIIRIGFGGSF